jgi:hypothetical protein
MGISTANALLRPPTHTSLCQRLACREPAHTPDTPTTHPPARTYPCVPRLACSRCCCLLVLQGRPAGHTHHTNKSHHSAHTLATPHPPVLCTQAPRKITGSAPHSSILATTNKIGHTVTVTYHHARHRNADHQPPSQIAAANLRGIHISLTLSHAAYTAGRAIAESDSCHRHSQHARQQRLFLARPATTARRLPPPCILFSCMLS